MAVSLYEHIVQVSEDYLGPAGERFIRRQISTHLGIKPEALKKSDIAKLVNWTSLAYALLTDDPRDVRNFIEDLMSIEAD